MSTILGIGNCHFRGMVKSAAAVLGMVPTYLRPDDLNRTGIPADQLSAALAEADVVLVARTHLEQVQALARWAGRPELQVVAGPLLHFNGFHPDLVTPVKKGFREFLDLPMATANSAILLSAWRDGVEAEEALSLFRDEVYEALGFYEAFPLALELLIDECRLVGLDVEPLMPRWMAAAPFVYVPIHPKIAMLRDIGLTLLQNAGFYDGPLSSDVIEDDRSRNLIWPVYPPVAERLGIEGGYTFYPRQDLPADTHQQHNFQQNRAPMDLQTFVERTYAAYRESPPDLTRFARLSDSRFDDIARFVRRKTAGSNINPYKGLPDANWWSRSVAETAPEAVDPVIEAKFRIGRKDRIASAGSCFAQHIARRLQRARFNYLVTERAPAQCADPSGEDYGTFTARYGNIYTVRQLVQLAERAYGRFEPSIDAWKRADGAGHVDPFRPRIGASPFGSIDQLRAARELHFAAVREMFETADVFIFTLGLTECWWSSDDCSVVPLHPGAVGVELPRDAYQPKNFTVAEVLADLQHLLDIFNDVNRTAKIILTVSPVPLIATFGREHVLAATSYSKSVLRAAAGEIAKNNGHVDYFPSFEIVTGSYNRGRYFAEDLRSVTEEGVDHVMRSFLRHYTSAGAEAKSAAGSAELFRAEAAAAMDIICDEEEIAVSAGVSAADGRFSSPC